MPISLPDGVVANSAEPSLLDFGTLLTPFGGGPVQRLNRLGLRLAGRFTIPPTVYADKGMALISRLMQAKNDRLLIEFYQPGFDPGPVGTPLVRVAVSGGTTLQLKGLPAAKVMKEGQALSLVKDRRYVHLVTAPGTANGSGDITLSVWPPMRVALSVNDAVEIAEPKMEGILQPGEELSWRLSVERLVAVSFTVAEGK